MHALGGRHPTISRSRALAALGLVLAVPWLTFAGPPARADPVTDETEFVLRTNAFRVSRGLVPLVVDDQMTEVARAWAAVMARAGETSRNPQLETQVIDWRHLGENVGVGQSVDAIQAGFESEPAQYRNLADPAFRSVGVGVVEAGGNLWVTVDLKTPESGAAIPPVPSVLAPAEPPAGPLTPLAPDPPEVPRSSAVGHRGVIALPAPAELAAPTVPSCTGSCVYVRAKSRTAPAAAASADLGLGHVRDSSAVVLLLAAGALVVRHLRSARQGLL